MAETANRGEKIDVADVFSDTRNIGLESYEILMHHVSVVPAFGFGATPFASLRVVPAKG